MSWVKGSCLNALPVAWQASCLNYLKEVTKKTTKSMIIVAFLLGKDRYLAAKQSMCFTPIRAKTLTHTK